MLATATMALPHHAKSETSKRSRRDPVPLVTTRVESAIAVPPQHAYDRLIREAADQYGVDALLIKSIVQVESAFNVLAVSRAGARGLMQLMPELAAELGVDDPHDARQNIMAGAQYLRRLLDRYNGNVRLALAGYNAGPATVSRYGGVPPFPETQNYVSRVRALLERARRQEKDSALTAATPATRPKRL
jgi:soluble lytic murein transglycosylase-like protein